MPTDLLHRYLFENRHVRGELVQLNASYARMLEGHDYPSEIANLLGEALAATCLLTATLKFEGEITLQIQGDGALSLLVINGRNDQNMRGIARINGEVPASASFKELIGSGQMVITIAPDKGERYQGIIALDSNTLTGCIENYFIRSEQLATKLKLFADVEKSTCGGMLLQALPGENEQQDFEHLAILVETLSADEVFRIDAQTLLHRLFHEEQVRLYEPQKVAFKCSCSRERSMGAIIAMGKEEIASIFAEQKTIEINCQYCNKNYQFNAADFN